MFSGFNRDYDLSSFANPIPGHKNNNIKAIPMILRITPSIPRRFNPIIKTIKPNDPIILKAKIKFLTYHPYFGFSSINFESLTF
ncbi:hypothetical protein ES708_01291 [subsurface metagenome]